MRARDQSSIFSTGGKFRPDYGLLLELHALTLVAHSYALLLSCMTHQKVQGILPIGIQTVVEKLLPFVNIVSPF